MLSYFQPANCPVLKQAVQSYWQVERHRVLSEREVIIPKGTLEIIFNLEEEENLETEIANRTCDLPRCFISGYHTGPIRMALPRRHFLFGINLRPTAAQMIFNLNAADFVNHCLDLTLIDKSIDNLWHQIIEAKTFHERVIIFAAWLAPRLPPLSPREKLLDQFLNDHQTTYSVPEVSNALHYSSRQLCRKLQTLTGMNVEQSLLYKKYLRSLNLIHGSSESLSGITYECGFTDQSHFIKTFKSFAGMPPGEYRSLKSHITGHIFENVR
jgi:AraC-like DNA-binding protein